MKTRTKDLTRGDITSTLIKLAIPIMATSLVNMLYNLTDMMWLGRYSTQSAAAAGTAGYFTSLAAGIILIVQTGSSIGVAQSFGKKDYEGVGEYISNGLKLNLLLALTYSLILFIFREPLVDFFKIDNLRVVEETQSYLKIISVGLLFQFFNPVFSSIFNAMGNSVTPFKINTVGLALNIILDPILIFGIGPFKELGIVGAGLATSLAQIVVLLLFLLELVRHRQHFMNVSIIKPFNKKYLKKILSLGLPGFLEATLRTSIGMIMLKILAVWGDKAIAVQSVGIQIESISWMSAQGFSSALSSFSGQNYGVRNIERVNEGYNKGIKIVGLLGLIVSFVFIFLGEFIFSLFLPEDPLAIQMGGNYLRILGFSQTFMCIEIATMGCFNGISRPIIPSVISVGMNGLRIPISKILSATGLGLDGIWWAISGTSIIKGLLTYPLCKYTLNRLD